ncbi:MAG: hypothetical protein E7Y34_02570, partial [Mycoplasma sp.]|nr:hypothetical protein [Mycoplasma sp.]
MNVPVSTETLLVKVIKLSPVFKDFKVYLSNQDIILNDKNPLVISVKVDFVNPLSSYIKEDKKQKKYYYSSITNESCTISMLSLSRDISVYPVMLQKHFREWTKSPTFYDIKFHFMFENWMNLSSLEGTDKVTRFQLRFNVIRDYLIERSDAIYVDDFVL